MRRHVFAFFLVLAVAACGGTGAVSNENKLEEQSGLTAVRLIGSREGLEKIAKAAAQVRWTRVHYDNKGRLILSVPENYSSDDFGRLLEAIKPFNSKLQGLQMIGPHGGVVDAEGIEHPDD